MKINEYIVQQRRNSNKHKLLEIKPKLGEWKQSCRKKPRKGEVILSRLRIDHTRTRHFLLTMCHTCQTEYAMKSILIECTNLAYIRETFYSVKSWNECCYVISKSGELKQKNLKEFSTRPNFFYKLFLYKNYFNQIWSLFHKLFLCQKRKKKF